MSEELLINAITFSPTKSAKEFNGLSLRSTVYSKVAVPLGELYGGNWSFCIAHLAAGLTISKPAVAVAAISVIADYLRGALSK